MTVSRQCIAVLDNDGPGVSHSDLGRLADRFYRGSGVQSPGSGLGLSIVERIARYFDTHVQFGTGLGGRGLGVIVEFPAQPASQGGAPAGESVAQRGGEDVARQTARSA